MKFNCKEISINDEDLGCQILFTENADIGSKSENMSVKEIMESTGKYLLIQRFYPEDDFEDDYESGNSYYETHDKNLCGDFEDFELELSRQFLVLKFPTENIEISIQPTEKEFIELKTLLPVLTNKNGKLIINE
ncbi:MAG: hypothetical protein PHT07_23710 [Paludibacter sp.]|nr:hypothetical protein [Paludibacter sp.]